jgi:hypothetical protein
MVKQNLKFARATLQQCTTEWVWPGTSKEQPNGHTIGAISGNQADANPFRPLKL